MKAWTPTIPTTPPGPNARIVRYLTNKNPTIEYLIGHHEYTLLEGYPLWLERDEEYRTRQVDPGDRFKTPVRRRVREPGPKGPSQIASEETDPNPIAESIHGYPICRCFRDFSPPC